jgi:hypothetical protein
MSLGWEFSGHKFNAPMPEPGSWAGAPAPGQRGEPGARQPLVDAGAKTRAFAPTDDELAAELPRSDEEVQRDLKALFAIRDAALADAAGRPAQHPDRPDFEPTRPFDDPDPLPRRR